MLAEANGPLQAFELLASMSIEPLLKGIRVAFDMQEAKHHRLNELRADVGIAVSADDEIILEAMNEVIYWRARYPAPAKAVDWPKALDIRRKQTRGGGSLANYYIKERAISPENYGRLWDLFESHYFKAIEARHESAA
jgi:hypothetical protein